ncbi:hypothetical protein RISK_005096 [Rhodopirellula islandica]|uniref:Uncharacterized protein n=1 Tax=Rhodopirellula islandica TaxID=595434 RepID=A0A0J1B7I6_RHOIS|nr:hypothetical protein RISK_005096 [Rhodopirellula islandica]
MTPWNALDTSSAKLPAANVGSGKPTLISILFPFDRDPF